eukprot:4693557-Prymnesium_polylepis.1
MVLHGSAEQAIFPDQRQDPKESRPGGPPTPFRIRAALMLNYNERLNTRVRVGLRGRGQRGFACRTRSRVRHGMCGVTA